MGQGHQCGDVGVDHRGPVRQLGALRRRGALRQAGVVDQQIDLAERGRQRQQGRFHRHRIADVEGGGMHHVLAIALAQRLQALAATAGGDHLPATLREAVDGGGAEAGGGAGNQDGAGHAGNSVGNQTPILAPSAGACVAGSARSGPTCRGDRYNCAMINNDVLRSVRYSLDLGDHHVVTLCQMADPAFAVDNEQVKAWLRREDEAGFEAMSDRALAHFLDGRLVPLRGRAESQPQRAVETRIDNNLVLKKLRVAFQLRDVDLMEIFASAGFKASKSEVGALFRQPGHANYRRCLDQMLRNFLKGLSLRLRG
ncbi:hypothetical protein G6F24_013290 [Rhizopus arrhizus]|nr:hypothetical protein G6F24_013290 [Rhizopus arrhizus]